MDRLLESLDMLCFAADQLWHDRVSEATVASYGHYLQQALKQFTRASAALDSQDISQIERLLTRSFNFRVGKERLLDTRSRRKRISRDMIEEIQWQINEKRINREEFTTLFMRLRRRHERRAI